MQLKPFSTPSAASYKSTDIGYTASARNLESWMSVADFIAAMYPFVERSQIESLYGFAHLFSPLYGGRTYKPDYAFRRHHLAEMKELGIGVSLNLTNHFFMPDAYERSLPLLETLHAKGNSITCFNHDLARRLRADFPLYELKASIIRGLKTQARLEAMLPLYDKLVVPMDLNDDADFLAGLPEKDRIILFANASCAYNCPNRSCYVGFSQKNMGMEVTSLCSMATHERVDLGKVFFDMDAFVDMGFRHFKLVPARKPRVWETKRQIMAYEASAHFVAAAQKNEAVFTLNSYPKSGRSWVRYFLAQYFQLVRGLDIEPNLASMFSLFPNDKSDPKRGVEALNTRLAPQIPLLFFSHQRSVKGQPRRNVLLLRSIPDILVSEFHHFTAQGETATATLSDFVLREQRRGVGGLCDYLNAWATTALDKDSLVLTYEDLRANPVQGFSRLLSYLGETPDPEVLSRAIAASDFTAMQQAEQEQQIPGMTYSVARPEAWRVRRGVVGGFRDEMPIGLRQQVAAYLDNHLTADGQELVRRFTLMPADILNA